MKMYKGFTQDMKCRDFQYEEGKTYEEDNAKLCNNGFHACEDPIDCFGYYPPGSSVYHEVDLDGVTDEKEDDSKRAGTKISIGAKVSLAGMVAAHFEYVKEHCEREITAGRAKAATAGANECATAGHSGAATAGDSGAATAGDSGVATAGDSGVATAGYRGAATAGYRGAATAGDSGAATAGESGVATAGDSGAATAGESGVATAGYRGAATAGESGAATAGYRGAATAGESGAATAGAFGRANGGGSAAVGEHGVAIVKGDVREHPRVKGGIGSVLVITEEQKNNYEIARWKAEQVDGERIKANTWYMLDENGEFTEV